MRNCIDCSIPFEVTGRNHKRCFDCAVKSHRKAVLAWAIKTGKHNGRGSGSSTGFGEKNPYYKHGKLVFKRWAREKKASLGMCERCGKNLKEATHHQWVGHHRDHNPENNVIENLELLCKRCHQLEHECHKAFEGVTTIRDENTGRFKRIEAPVPANAGDDMVCSV